jgi:large subunit ribosomal protein L4
LVILADEEAAAGKSFRNIERVEALPVQDAGVADVVGAASLLVSEAALPQLVARAAKPSREPGSVSDSATNASAPEEAA